MSKFISMRKANTLLTKNNAIILDVRTKKEFCKSHLCEAMHFELPLPPLSNRQLNDFCKKLQTNLSPFRKSQQIIVYCKKGIRAGHAVRILKKIGYKNSYNLGGIAFDPLKKYFQNPIYKRLNICKCSS